jgi:thymidylate kinase
MPFIAFLGCDGCGKSAVIAALATDGWAKGVHVATGHWRPFPFRGRSSEGSGAADNPHGAKARGGMASVMKLGWLWLNWWAGWWGGLRGEAARGLVLFDRYHGDLLVDPTRYRYGGPMAVAKLVVRFMPQPDLVVFLDAAPEILLSRKQEVGHAALEASRERYLRLCEGGGRFVVVDASLPLEEVVARVSGHITRLSR